MKLSKVLIVFTSLLVATVLIGAAYPLVQSSNASATITLGTPKHTKKKDQDIVFTITIKDKNNVTIKKSLPIVVPISKGTSADDKAKKVNAAMNTAMPGWKGKDLNWGVQDNQISITTPNTPEGNKVQKIKISHKDKTQEAQNVHTPPTASFISTAPAGSKLATSPSSISKLPKNPPNGMAFELLSAPSGINPETGLAPGLIGTGVNELQVSVHFWPGDSKLLIATKLKAAWKAKGIDAVIANNGDLLLVPSKDNREVWNYFTMTNDDSMGIGADYLR